jgi:hypothetical protein
MGRKSRGDLDADGTEDMRHLASREMRKIAQRKQSACKILHACLPISAEKIEKIGEHDPQGGWGRSP